VSDRKDAVLRIEDLHVDFPLRGRGILKGSMLRAVDGVSLTVNRGETLGLVGESGCGKTTVVRAVLRLQKATSGRIFLNGQDITTMSRRQLRTVRPKMQVVFQDPFSSLDPRMNVHDIIAEPLRVNRRYKPERVHELLEQVGMTPDMEKRLPAAFSGGQRQRIGIARSLALEPDLLILDEPVSALDVSIRAQVVNLLTRLQKELDLTYLFIAHDLSVVRFMSHRVAVMYLGKIVETGERDDIYRNPQHPYTQSLLDAVPVPRPAGREGRRRGHIKGDTPDPANPPSGCSFRTRCPRVQERCAVEEPPLEQVPGAGSAAACWYPGPAGARSETIAPPEVAAQP
jgi:peptide/nickel transport system ATP-binding protein/oligopeptide transport system ATP-binding protein